MNAKDDTPFFSVVIPTYNHAHLIKKCLDSLIHQTFGNWEAIIINNYSDDNTIELIESYCDQRIKIINFKNNGIIGASRNVGINNARGDWICFLDSDDLWYQAKLETVFQRISGNPEADVIGHDLYMINSFTGKKTLLSSGPVTKDFYRVLLTEMNRFPNSSMSINKSFLDRNNLRINESQAFVSVEDYDLWLNMARLNAKFECINIPLGEYFVGAENVSRTEIHLRNLGSMLYHHVHYIQQFETDKKKLWRLVSARLKIAYAASAFNNGHFLDSVKHFSKAVSLSVTVVIKYILVRTRLSIKRMQ